MTPAARLQAAIDLLDAIAETPKPADAVVAAYLRERRFIGGGDRRALVDLAYGVLRRFARLDWWRDRLGLPQTARTMLLLDRAFADEPVDAFDGSTYGPAKLDTGERKALDQIKGQALEHKAMPEITRVECPDWAEPGLRRELGADFAAELSAMREPAALHLRVNPLLAERPAVLAALEASNIRAKPGEISPHAIIVSGRPDIAQHPLFKSGAIEVQDEGSQMIAALVAARPGMQVLDLCAGAGGKSLAIAAGMDGRGRVVACDVLAGKLRRAKDRFKRASLHNVETRVLGGETPEAVAGDKWLKRQKAKFDRVLVDAPCSGTGTWRRNPDARWWPLGPGLEALVPLQAQLLDRGARATRPGGWLIYATCSLLAEENEDQISGFLARNPDFHPLPPAILVPSAGLPQEAEAMRLTPARHGTDGFFAAVLERDGVDEADEQQDADPDGAA